MSFSQALNRFCQLKHTKSEVQFIQTALEPPQNWACTIRIHGLEFISQGLAASKKHAQERATIEYLEYLQNMGMLDNVPAPKKQRLAAEAAARMGLPPPGSITAETQASVARAKALARQMAGQKPLPRDQVNIADLAAQLSGQAQAAMGAPALGSVARSAAFANAELHAEKLSKDAVELAMASLNGLSEEEMLAKLQEAPIQMGGMCGGADILDLPEELIMQALAKGIPFAKILEQVKAAKSGAASAAASGGPSASGAAVGSFPAEDEEDDGYLPMPVHAGKLREDMPIPMAKPAPTLQKLAPPTGKPCKSIDSFFQQMLDHARRANPDGARDLVEREAENFAGFFSVAQMSKFMQCLSTRADVDKVLDLMDLIDDTRLIFFVDEGIRNYYNKFMRWIVREMLAQGQSVIDLCTKHDPKTLEKIGQCVPDCKAAGGKGGTDLVLTPTKSLTNSRDFQKGDWLFITFPADGLVGAIPGEGSSASFEAELSTVSPTSITVKLFGSTKDVVETFLGQNCRVDRAGNRVTYHRQVEAMKVFGNPNDSGAADWLRSALTAGFGDPTRKFTAEVAALSANYFTIGALEGNSAIWRLANESQKEALRMALSRRMTLIQGPPGTGKTHTSVLLVRLWIASGRGPVLVCADSNVAVDNLLTGCSACGLNCVRVGRPEATRPDLEQYNLLERSKEQSSLATIAAAQLNGNNFWAQEKKALAAAEVICCTCSGADHPVLQDMTFPTVIIDEAAQATEPAVLVPLLRLNTHGAFALVGDHKQLAPTVVCQNCELEGLGQPLFTRFVKLGVKPLMLETQYRMHPALAAYPALNFYGDRLKSGVTGRHRPAPGGINWPDKRVPLVFLPVPGQDIQQGTSFCNEAEVATIEDILAALMDTKELKPHQIGIITPYQGQVQHLRRVLQSSSKLPKGTVERGRSAGLGVEIMSVDGFQGREKELIIVSTVRANPGGKVGFVSDAKRLNVTITRARRGMIVCGHFETLARDAHSWGPWLAWMWARGLVTGYEATDSAASARLRSLDGLDEDELELFTGSK